jgi:ketosteroid isomerase-like protein
MDHIDAVAFSREWEAAWNRRDVEAVLKHFHDDAVFTSPVAKQIGFADDGVVKGKDALRRYWNAALKQNPDLHFQITGIFQGVDRIAIAFKNQKGVDRVEILVFRDGLVIEGHGTFAAG